MTLSCCGNFFYPSLDDAIKSQQVEVRQTKAPELAAKFPKKKDIPVPDQRLVLSWNDILSGSINLTLDLKHLRFVIDETKEDRIQFAIYPYREGKVVLSSPTSELPVIGSIAIFNIASTLVKAIVEYDSHRDKLVLDMTHIKIFVGKLCQASC